MSKENYNCNMRQAKRVAKPNDRLVLPQTVTLRKKECTSCYRTMRTGGGRTSQPLPTPVQSSQTTGTVAGLTRLLLSLHLTPRSWRTILSSIGTSMIGRGQCSKRELWVSQELKRVQPEPDPERIRKVWAWASLHGLRGNEGLREAPIDEAGRACLGRAWMDLDRAWRCGSREERPSEVSGGCIGTGYVQRHTFASCMC